MSFKDDDGRESYKQYYLPTVEIKYDVMIDGRNIFDQLIKNDFKAYNIRKIECFSLLKKQKKQF